MDTPGEILLYQSEDGETRIDVRLFEESVWLSLNQIADLFGRDKSVISRHISNVFEEGELEREGTVAKFATVQEEGGRQIRRDIEHYNLDVIISVGYRVKSLRGVQFRRWATLRLKEYIIKGFVMDDERLSQARHDYFDELVRRVRRIRVSERRFYQKITDIFATSVDYDPKSDITKTFFATVQNKFHYAIHGMTAPESPPPNPTGAGIWLSLLCFRCSRTVSSLRSGSRTRRYLPRPANSEAAFRSWLDGRPIVAGSSFLPEVLAFARMTGE